MDLREFNFWLGEAERDEISRRVGMMSSVRFAMWADERQFSRFMSDLQRQIAVLDGSFSQQVEDNWAGLRSLKRG